MQVIIPLAGKGTRMRPHTHTKAKPLFSIAGKPVLAHILDDLKKFDFISEIIFVTGYLGHQIEEFVSKRYDFKTRYVEQKELKGQAHAIKLVEEFIKEDVLIWFVDTISDADISLLKKVDADGVIYVKDVDNPLRFGQIKSDSNGIITEIKEKADPPISNNVNIGLYYVKDHKMMFKCIDEIIEKDMQTKGEYYLMDAFQVMIDKGSTFKALEVDVWEDCGTKKETLKTNRYFLKKSGGNNPKAKDSLIIDPVFIHKDAKVENSIIGPYVSVDSGTVIKNSIVKDSIIGSDALVENALLKNSLIGEGAIFKSHFDDLNIGDSSEITHD